jgi:hypothetical protein
VGLAARRHDLRPVPAGPVVFTRPPALRALVRRPQTALADSGLRAAAPARITRAADPHEVGGLSGGLGVLPPGTRPASVWTTGGVGSCQPTVPGAEHVLHSWGRSVPRLALRHSRLRAIEHDHGCVRSQEAQAQRWRPMTWPAAACIRRALHHVGPQGFPTVRS